MQQAGLGTSVAHSAASLALSCTQEEPSSFSVVSQQYGRKGAEQGVDVASYWHAKPSKWRPKTLLVARKVTSDESLHNVCRQ